MVYRSVPCAFLIFLSRTEVRTRTEDSERKSAVEPESPLHHSEHPRMDRKKRKGRGWKKATAPEPQWRKGMEIHARQPLRQSPVRSTRGMRNPTHCAICQSDR